MSLISGAQPCIGLEPVFFGGKIHCPSSAYKLVFYDDFEGDRLDISKWYTYIPNWPEMDDQSLFSRTHDVATGPTAFKELQIFRDENILVSDGTVKLIAKRETGTWFGVTKDFSSAWLQAKMNFKYGKFEFRFKLPAGTGFWPAIWLWGNGENPSGIHEDHEIDIIEYCGEEPSKHHITYHYHNNMTDCKAVQSPFSYNSVNFSTDFHVLTCEYCPQYIKVYCDGILVRYEPLLRTFGGQHAACGDELGYGTYLFSNFIPTVYMNLILNLSLSGQNSYCEPVNDLTPFPAQVEIDYVKVWQRDGDDLDQITIYPNPAVNSITANYTLINSDINRVIITDVNGIHQKTGILDDNGKEMVLDISLLPSGIYFITYHTHSRVYRSKFVKTY